MTQFEGSVNNLATIITSMILDNVGAFALGQFFLYSSMKIAILNWEVLDF